VSDVHPLPEPDRCATPSDGSITSVEIGRGGSGPFVPLSFGDLVDVTTGGQGFSMTAIRCRIRGTHLPACIRQRTGAAARPLTSDDWNEVPLKTYPQADGSRVTKEFWFILQVPLWFRLTGEVAGQTVAVDLRSDPSVPAPAAGSSSYATLRVRGAAPGLTPADVCWQDAPATPRHAASPLDGAALWRDGQLLGVVRPGTAQRTEPAWVSSCADADLVGAAAIEGAPDGELAYLAGGTLQFSLGTCSQPATDPRGCDGLGGPLVAHSGDQLDLHATAQYWPAPSFYLTEADGGADVGWRPLLRPSGDKYYLTLP
jgi:hypothetical protein